MSGFEDSLVRFIGLGSSFGMVCVGMSRPEVVVARRTGERAMEIAVEHTALLLLRLPSCGLVHLVVTF